MRANPSFTLPFPSRLLEGFAAAGLISAVYFAAGERAQHLRPAWEHAVDGLIPFVPASVWIYMPGYWGLFVLATWAVKEPVRWRAALLGLVSLTVAALPFFLLWPVWGPRPAAPEDATATAALIRWLYANDPAVNTFPSLHVANATYCALLIAANAPRLRWVAGLGAVLIAISVLTLKQHWLVDVPAGCLLGALGFGAWRAVVALPAPYALPERPFAALAPDRVLARIRRR